MMLKSSISSCIKNLNQYFHSSAIVSASVFLKKQARLDPAIAITREQRKRRKLERQIKELKKYSKKPKPIEELRIDVFSAKNIGERRREPSVLTGAQRSEILDQRKVVRKQYSKSRSKLMLFDYFWVKQSLERQKRALELLKICSPQLYEAAMQPDVQFAGGLAIKGPSLSPPISTYQSPDANRVPAKHKKPRTSFTKNQIIILENRFLSQKYLASNDRSKLASQLAMHDTQVKTWFQNRRTKWRRQEAEEREVKERAALKMLSRPHINMSNPETNSPYSFQH